MQANFGSREELTIAGTITSKSGTNFEYSIKVVEPTYFAEKAAARMLITKELDVADEMTKFSSANVLQQAATAMLDLLADHATEHAGVR